MNISILKIHFWIFDPTQRQKNYCAFTNGTRYSPEKLNVSVLPWPSYMSNKYLYFLGGKYLISVIFTNCALMLMHPVMLLVPQNMCHPSSPLLLNWFKRKINKPLKDDISSTQPAYLNSMLTPARNSRQLRSTSSNPLYIPRVKTKAGTRAFSVAAPTVWNSLPASVKSQGNIVSFRRHLKTYLFDAAYPH